jgi:hypothetical protein
MAVEVNLRQNMSVRACCQRLLVQKQAPGAQLLWGSVVLGDTTAKVRVGPGIMPSCRMAACQLACAAVKRRTVVAPGWQQADGTEQRHRAAAAPAQACLRCMCAVTCWYAWVLQQRSSMGVWPIAVLCLAPSTTLCCPAASASHRCASSSLVRCLQQQTCKQEPKTTLAPIS